MINQISSIFYHLDVSDLMAVYRASTLENVDALDVGVALLKSPGLVSRSILNALSAAIIDGVSNAFKQSRIDG